MKRFMKPSLFPDVNVWVALTHGRHAHHRIAADWFQQCEEAVYFCRFTQLGLLRLLTNEQVMGTEAMSQSAAWQAYHRWFEDERIDFHREPETPEFEKIFRELSSRSRRSTKLWADAYLAAFAMTAGLTLVTFDRALSKLAREDVILLK